MQSRPFVALMLLAICAISVWLRFSALAFDTNHPDEPIATAVVQGVIKNSRLDTDWTIHEVPESFKNAFAKGQYNFSSYYLTLVVLDRIASVGSFDFDLKAMRATSMVLSVAIILATFALGWRLGGNPVGLGAALMAAASSQLYMDGLYARPEAFFTLLTLLICYAAVAAEGRSYLLLTASSAGVGLSLACKISAALLAPLPAFLFLLSSPRISASTWLRVGCISSLAMLAGAFLGAPFAFLHLNKFVAGAMGLVKQYSTGGGPLGLRDGSLLERVGYLLGYIAPTVGWPALALACVGFYAWFRASNKILMTIGLATVLSIAYLGSRPTFFERNFSHYLPLLYIAVAFGMQAVSGRFKKPCTNALAFVVLVVASTLPGALVLYTIRFDILTGNHNERVAAFRQRIAERNMGLALIIWPNLTYGEAYTAMKAHLDKHSPPFLVEFFDHDDRYSKQTLSRFLGDYNATEVSRLSSPFSHISPSTLQQYYAVTHVVFRVDQSGKSSLNLRPSD